MHFFDANKGCSGSKLIRYYFLMEVMMYFRVADMMVLGMICGGLGSKIQQFYLR